MGTVSFEECHSWQPDVGPCRACGAGEGDQCQYSEKQLLAQWLSEQSWDNTDELAALVLAWIGRLPQPGHWQAVLQSTNHRAATEAVRKAMLPLVESIERTLEEYPKVVGP